MHVSHGLVCVYIWLWYNQPSEKKVVKIWTLFKWNSHLLPNHASKQKPILFLHFKNDKCILLIEIDCCAQKYFRDKTASVKKRVKIEDVFKNFMSISSKSRIISKIL